MFNHTAEFYNATTTQSSSLIVAVQDTCNVTAPAHLQEMYGEPLWLLVYACLAVVVRIAGGMFIEACPLAFAKLRAKTVAPIFGYINGKLSWVRTNETIVPKDVGEKEEVDGVEEGGGDGGKGGEGSTESNKKPHKNARGLSERVVNVVKEKGQEKIDARLDTISENVKAKEEDAYEEAYEEAQKVEEGLTTQVEDFSADITAKNEECGGGENEDDGVGEGEGDAEDGGEEGEGEDEGGEGEINGEEAGGGEEAEEEEDGKEVRRWKSHGSVDEQ